jgi:hypothetical protein
LTNRAETLTRANDCTYCDQALAQEAAFCWRCGHARRVGITIAGELTRYDTCAIVYGQSARTRQPVFVAEALGESGPYTAGESAPLQWRALSLLGGESRAVLDRLVAELLDQGWTSLGTYGFYYWEHRFHRPWTAHAPAEERIQRLAPGRREER